MEWPYQNDEGEELIGYLIRPADMDETMLYPGVVVYGGFTGDGGQRFERDYAREYARKGMVAFLPDYFTGRHDQDNFDQVLDAAIQYSTLFEDGVRSQRLAILAWEQITSLPYVDSDRLGAFGFCFGGAMAMQAARAGANWKVAAGLHAEYPPMTDYIGDSWNMEYFAEFSGDADPFVPPSHIEGWHAELSASPSDYEVVLFEGGLHGFAMKYSEATYQVIASISGSTSDDVIYDDEGTAVGIKGTFMYDQEHRDFAFNRIDELFAEYGVIGTATEEPSDDGCDCDMSGYVAMEDFDALRAEVRELQGSLGSVEADNNDVMNAMEEMATCMSGIVDGFSGEEYDTEEPMTEAPETTRMRSTTTTTTTTTTMEPTKMPSLYPTMRMTEKWETMARMAEGPNKCGTASDERAFRLTFTSLDNCVDRCYGDSRCNFASTDMDSWCIGCIVVDKTSDGWTAYEMMRGRRQLSEVEALRRENAALKAELARVRRN